MKKKSSIPVGETVTMTDYAKNLYEQVIEVGGADKANPKLVEKLIDCIPRLLEKPSEKSKVYIIHKARGTALIRAESPEEAMRMLINFERDNGYFQRFKVSVQEFSPLFEQYDFTKKGVIFYTESYF